MDNKINTFKQILNEATVKVNSNDFKGFYYKKTEEREKVLSKYGLQISWYRQGFVIYNEANGIKNGFYLARDKANGKIIEKFKFEGLGIHEGENFSSNRYYPANDLFDEAVVEIVKILKNDNSSSNVSLKTEFHREFESLIQDFALRMGANIEKGSLPEELDSLETQALNFIKRLVKNVG